MAVWYCGSTKYSAVATWAASTAYSVGDIVRPLTTPTVGQERVRRCTTAGTSSSTEPTWSTAITKGSTISDGTCVWTEITGNSTYGWAAAHARVETLCSWMAAGDDGYISNNHTQTKAGSCVFTSPGTAANPCRILCVDDSAAPPTALATGAVIATTGDFNYPELSGCAYFYGLTLRAGTSTNRGSILLCSQTTGVSQWNRLENCTLELLGSSTAATISIGPPNTGSGTRPAMTEFINTTCKFSSTSQAIEIWNEFVWRNTPSAIQGATIPTTIVRPINATMGSGNVLIHGVDLSALGSGKNLVDISQAKNMAIKFLDCKLGAINSVTIGAMSGRPGAQVDLINCDSADTNYRFARATYQGTEVNENTIVRSGGASDGTTTISRKIVTLAGAKLYSPYESLPIEFWNETVGSAITVTIPVLTDNVTLTDADAWIDVEYLGTSGFPLGNFADDRVADIIFGTPANQATDSTSTWTTTGLTTPVKQTLDVTVTPQEKGIVRVRVMVARASTTLYYDPFVQVS